MPTKTYAYCMLIKDIDGSVQLHVCTKNSEEISEWEFYDLVRVPEPHGDLIDRKALDIYQRAEAAHAEYQEDEDNEYLEGMADGLREAAKQLSFARTIIPASEEGET